MASRRRGSRRSTGRSKRRSTGRSKRRSTGRSKRRSGGKSSGGKAARRARVVANKRKSELKRANNKVRSAKRVLRIAVRSAGKRKAAFRQALSRAKRA